MKKNIFNRKYCVLFITTFLILTTMMPIINSENESLYSRGEGYWRYSYYNCILNKEG